MYSDNTVNKLNEIAMQYRPLIYDAIHKVISDGKFSNTRAGADSLVVEVSAGDATKAPDILITFDDHLIVLNKRKVEWTKHPNMKPLIAWAETKTRSELEAKKLAFATAWHQKTNDTWKPKPWRKKSLSQVLKEMNELILSEYDKVIDEDLQQAVNI